jgi:hypothetical protein
MPARDGPVAPKVGDLTHQVIALLEQFDPTTLAYLGVDGYWKTGPRCLRDRISNELWFRIWQCKGNVGFDEELGRLFQLLVQDDYHWGFATNAFAARIPEEVSGKAGLLVAAELLYCLIEYDALETNSKAYVADWDSGGRRRKVEFADRAERLLNTLASGSGCDEKAGVFCAIHARLRTVQIRVFHQVRGVIAEEERLSYRATEPYSIACINHGAGWAAETVNRAARKD